MTNPSPTPASRFLRWLGLIWASPNSLLGLSVGIVGLLVGGRCQVRRGCLEFHGGLVRKILEHLPTGTHIAAMTLGHIILGRSVDDLDQSRDHEHVHVRQYERWGPLFLPAYLGCSLVLWLRRKDPYFDNPFEVEAYTAADPCHQSSDSDSID